MIAFYHGWITWRMEKFYMQRNAYKKAPHAFSCDTCGLCVKADNFACIYVASSSCRMHGTACNKASILKLTSPSITSPSGCSLTYMQLRVFLPAIAGLFDCDSGCFGCKLPVFLPAIAGFFACVCGCFCLCLAGIFTCSSSVFACV